MIKLTRIHGSEIFVNEENIQWIENMPDTTITFLSGTKIIVKENIEEIVQKIELVLHKEKGSTQQEESV